MTMTNEQLTELAAEYIEAGVPVFPITLSKGAKGIEKVPATTNGHHDATLDAEEFAAMLHLAEKRQVPDVVVLGLGVVPGAAGLVVNDYDTKGGARGGLMLEHHRSMYGDEADAVSYTSVSGAVNVFHRKRNDIEIGNTSPWPDVDVRSDRGWIVPPGVSTPWGSWEWRSGELADIGPMPETMWAKLSAATNVDSAPADVTACRSWLAKGAAVSDIVEEMRLRFWLAEIRLGGNRNPALFEALSELRRTDPAYVNRSDWFRQISEAWVERMKADGERGRDDEPLSVLTRVVGHAQELDTIEAEIEGAPDSFDWIDLRPYLDGTVEELRPTLLEMSDGRCLLYRDRLNMIHGDSGSGKSFLAAVAIKQELRAGRNICILDMEDNPAPLVQRLLQIGTPDAIIDQHLKFAHPTEALEENVSRIVEQVIAAESSHVFIDSLGEAFSLSGIDENKDVEVSPWLHAVCVGIIEGTDAGVTLIDHGTKAAEKPLHPSGSKRKRAALTGAGWLVEATDEPFTKKLPGSVMIKCAKDRHGNYQYSSHVANMTMTHVGPMTTLKLEALDPQERAENVKPEDRDSQEIVVMACEKYRGDWLSQNEILGICKEMGLGRSSDILIGAMGLAAKRGLLEERAGARGAKERRYVKDWEPMGNQEYMDRIEGNE